MGFEISKSGVLSSYTSEMGECIVNIPESVKSIGKAAFKNIKGITTISIGPGVSKITVWGFIGCSDLIDINVDENNKFYSSKAGILYDKTGETLLFCPQGRKEVVVPSGVRAIANDAFSKAYKLNKVTLPNTIESIGKNAFLCTGIKSFTAPKALKTIGESAFSRCESLISIVFSSSTEEISNYAFSYCSSIKSVKIPPAIKIIRFSSFSNCSALEELIIPESVKRVEYQAFEACDMLSRITFLNSETVLEPMSFPETILKGYVHIKGKEDFYLSTKKTDKLATELTKKYSSSNKNPKSNLFRINGDTLDEYITPDSVTEKLDDAGCENIEEYIAWTGKIPSWAKIKVPGTVKIIGYNAFYFNYYINSIIISEGVEEIEENAFEDCLFLKSLSLPKSIKKIGIGALIGCGNIEEISFYKNNKKIKLHLQWLDGDLDTTKQIDLVCKFIVAQDDDQCQKIAAQITDTNVRQQLIKTINN